MKNPKSLIVITLLLFFILSCNALSPAAATPDQPASENNALFTEAEVPRVSVDDAKTAFDSGEAIIVDVRSQASYGQSHAAGALSIPLSEFETNITNIDLPKDQWIITYCT